MKTFIISKLAVVCSAVLSSAAACAENTDANPCVLWYGKPAATWEEALPLGNGRLGAMIFGTVAEEHLQLNEDTLTSDEPGYRNLPLNVKKDYAEITGLIAQRKFAEADKLVTARWLGCTWACYQPLGDLFIDVGHTGPVQNYRRELDIAKAVCKVSYQREGTTFTREMFASCPDEVIVIKLSADKPGSLNFRLRFTSSHPTTQVTANAESKLLTMHGQLPGMVNRRTLEWIEKKKDTWKYPELWDANGNRLPSAKTVMYGSDCKGRGTFFDARVRVETKGGSVSAVRDTLAVSGADEAVLIYTAASSYNGYDKSPSREGVDSVKKAQGFLESACKAGYEQLLDRQVKDYSRLFDRVNLDLGAPTAQSKLPTGERIKAFGNGEDPSLAALYFQFGRYLMISGSRPGTQPLNLQGLWNKEVIPPWASGYTININTEMNYWPVEVCNLSECAEPLLRMIRELAVDGRRVAKDMYGCRGWVAHHNTTLWRDAQPVDNEARCSFWPMGSGWLCLNLYEHYLFTGDKNFLEKDAYPLLKEACLFYIDWLVDNGKGRLVTPVSTSPENNFVYTNESGKKVQAGVSAGSGMDMAIIRELFACTAQASAILGTDAEFRSLLKEKSAKCLPYLVGAKGQLQEWQDDFEESEPHHRHVSHLFGLHPGSQITLGGTPELAAAAKKTLELRGDGGTGWSKAWKINFWSRLQDGDHAYKLVSELLTQSTHPNLLDVCPPFQIDGNFGGCAGIAEMLLQSHERTEGGGQRSEVGGRRSEVGDRRSEDGGRKSEDRGLEEDSAFVLRLLPALPSAWPNGQVRGLRARGGFEVDMAWANGRLVSAALRSVGGKACRVEYAGHACTLNLTPGQTKTLNGVLQESR